MLCLSCMYASPHGSVFCARCGRGLGCRVCPSGHKSPPGAKWCVTCGKADGELSGFTPFIDLARLSRVIAWAAVVFGAWYVLRHPAQALQGVSEAALAAASAVLGVSRCVIACSVRHMAFWILGIYALSFLLPEKGGSALRRGMVAIASRVPKAIFGIVRLTWRAVTLMLEGRTESTQPSKKQK